MRNWAHSHLIPQDRRARRITLLLLIPGVLIYLTRIWIHQTLEFERGPFGPLWWFICPAALVIFIIVAAIFITLTGVAIRRAKHTAPIVAFIVGVISAIVIPLPPLPLAVYPEEAYFLAQREQFEAVVELARQDALECSERGCEYSPRILPYEYAHLSAEGRVSVYREQRSNGLILKFRPFTFYYPIIYFEIPEDVNLGQYYICRGSRGVRKLDEHWYVCQEDWL